MTWVVVTMIGHKLWLVLSVHVGKLDFVKLVELDFSHWSKRPWPLNYHASRILRTNLELRPEEGDGDASETLQDTSNSTLLQQSDLQDLQFEICWTSLNSALPQPIPHRLPPAAMSSCNQHETLQFWQTCKQFPFIW